MDGANVADFQYADIVARPEAEVAGINDFLGGRLDIESALRAIDPTLYRNRAAGAASGLSSTNVPMKSTIT